MAVQKFVILLNVSSQLNFAGKGTKESHFKQALGAHYAKVKKKSFALISLFSSDNIKWALLVKNQPISASYLNLAWGVLQGGLTVNAMTTCAGKFLFSNL